VACLLVFTSSFAQRDNKRNPQRAAVGKLGQVKEGAVIYSRPDTKSKKLNANVKPDTYVIIRKISGDWVTLVMSDGTDGFMPLSQIEKLPYDVNIRKPEVSAAPATRGDIGRFARNSAPKLTGTDIGSQIVNYGTQFIGTKYVWGGNSLTGGIDCSGFVQQLFRRHGVSLPRTAQEQSYVGQAVEDLSQLQAGDRLYFTDSKRVRITHTGLYMGNGYFIHSSSSRNGIYIDPLSEKWIKILVNVRR
jgi:cell wall-associated NlpC family hydrolase